LEHFVSHNVIEDMIQNVSKDDYISKEIILETMEKAFIACKKRDEECDIHVTKFMIDRYKDERLFHSQQHPSNVLLMYVYNEIVNMLNKLLKMCQTHQTQHDLQQLVENDWQPKEELLQTSLTPILPCVKKSLELKFPLEQCWSNGTPVSLDDYLIEFYNSERTNL
jgi:uncharacterized membrane protein YheB (UPF0754 family)